MRIRVLVLAAAFAAFAATGASAQVLNLSGQFRCIQGCVVGAPGPAYITQTDWDMNIVNEAGMPTRAWIDRPGHIWTEAWDQGAIYSPDGMTVQFDSGTVWVRDLGPPPPPPAAVLVPVPVAPRVHKTHYHHPLRPLPPVGS
jgi:hypothetical protein